jgi:hypothetical protein
MAICERVLVARRSGLASHKVSLPLKEEIASVRRKFI